MQSAKDVAAAILVGSPRPLTQLQLQKHLYYVQASMLAWFGEPAFEDRIEGWIHGPVVPSANYGRYGRDPIPEPLHGDPSRLSERTAHAVRVVLDDLAGVGGWALRNETHSLPPWEEARQGLAPNEPGNREISRESIRTYHSRFGADLPRELTSEEVAVAERFADGDHEALLELLG